MQLLPIKIILDLHSPKSKVCAIELFYSRCLSCFLFHCSYLNLTLSSDTNCTSCRELTWNFQTYEKQNRENTRPKKIIITFIKQYLRGSAICLCPRSCRDFIIIREKNTKCDSIIFFLSQKTTTRNPNHQNNGFYILCTGFTMGYKPPLHGLSLRKSPFKNHAISFRVGSSSGSNTTRLHKAQHI